MAISTAQLLYCLMGAAASATACTMSHTPCSSAVVVVMLWLGNVGVLACHPRLNSPSIVACAQRHRRPRAGALSQGGLVQPTCNTARTTTPLAGRHGSKRGTSGWWATSFATAASSVVTPLAAAPTLTYAPTERNERLIKSTPSLARPYAPSLPWGFYGHLETVLGAMARQKPDVQYRRELVPCTDGGVVALDWLDTFPLQASAPALTHAAPTLLLLAGLTGGSESSYVRHAVCSARLAGFQPVVYNSRGCGDSPVLTPRLYSAADTADLRLALARIVEEKHPDAPLVAAGWSIGANLLVHCLAEDGNTSPISAAVGMANPWDLTLSDVLWRRGVRRFYDVHLATRLARMFAKHAALWPIVQPEEPGDGHDGIGGHFNSLSDGPSLQRVKVQRGLAAGGVCPSAAVAARTLREFDAAVTIHTFGFQDVHEYYYTASSCHVLHKVKVPMLLMQALDDPIAPAQAIPYDQVHSQDNLVLATTKHGGHLGWLMRGPGGSLFGAAWTDTPMLEFLTAALAALHDGSRADGSGGPPDEALPPAAAVSHVAVQANNQLGRPSPMALE